MSSIELMIESRKKDLGGFTVGRVLPYAKKQTVGPFIFLDHMGPAEFAPGQGMDVRPHPHIGLATVTFLFEGAITHRDSLGFQQDIRPGDVNWMTAGKGIVHSERTPGDLRKSGQKIHGLQIWVALPKEAEQIEPSFHHHPSSSLPEFKSQGAQVKLILGEAFEHKSPVKTYSPMFYFEVKQAQGGRLEYSVAPKHEVALYILSGEIEIDEQHFGPRQMPVLKTGNNLNLRSIKDSHFIVLGGEPLAEPRHIWWNFVASSKDLIEKAKAKWQEQGFDQVPGETEFIPLPKD